MSTHLAVVDTHALIWYSQMKWKRLGKQARRVLENADRGLAALYVPTVAIVEILEAARSGALELAGGARAWVSGLVATGSFFPVELTVEIVLRAEELYAIPERTDRLIAATAVHLDCPLLTRDPEIGRHPEVTVIW